MDKFKRIIIKMLSDLFQYTSTEGNPDVYKDGYALAKK